VAPGAGASLTPCEYLVSLTYGIPLAICQQADGVAVLDTGKVLKFPRARSTRGLNASLFPSPHPALKSTFQNTKRDHQESPRLAVGVKMVTAREVRV
jgi:hypothetical protein